MSLAGTSAVDHIPIASGDHAACNVAIVRGVDLAGLDTAQWASLVDRTIEPNPFYSRQVVQAGIEALAEGPGLNALMFRRRSDGRLVGLFPFRRRSLPLLGSARSALNPYQMGGVPLIDRDHAGDVARTFLGLAGSARGIPSRWAFPHVELDGPFSCLLADHASAYNAEVVTARAYKRPILNRTTGGFDAHVEAIIGKKRAKDIQRNLRRLGELGQVRFERTADPERVAERLEQFLIMERAGWKGRRGTAFLCKPDHARFARMAFTGEAVVTDSVLLDDNPIAICLNLAAGTSLFAPKCAFDESYRRYGAGLILEYLVIETFYADDRFAEMNASTTVGGHIVSSFWNEARAMGTLIVGPRGWQTRTHAQIEDATYAARQLAKRLVNRIRPT